MNVTLRRSNGFTIVEILTVTVIIGILAGIGVVAYNGMINRARMATANNDLDLIEVSISIAQTKAKKPLHEITETTNTPAACINQVDGTDLATLSRTYGCWVLYNRALDRISTASGVDIRNLVDPWGRPYYIDENETESECTKDLLGVYKLPHKKGEVNESYTQELPNTRSDC